MGVSSEAALGERERSDEGSWKASDECDEILGVVGAEEGGESAAEEGEDIEVTLDGYLRRGWAD